MIKVGSNAKIKVKWKVSPYDFSKEKRNEIQVAFANKYNIPKERVKVAPDFVMPSLSEGGNIVTSVTIDNIQDPAFQKKLYTEYLKVNEIKHYDLETIESIDNDINSKIDFKVYDKYRRFSIKWIKWANFQSYGGDNSFDFTTLNGLVLLNGEPANQSGKTTFAVDLLHFLLFGKSGKWDKLEGLFNYTIPEATQVYVEGCITIDGEDYIIKRTLTQPPLAKRTSKSKITQKVEYYRLVGDSMEGLEEYVEENGEDSRQTNKIIKESIGREDDFDLMMCITGSNLDALIDEKPTEKGRLFSRWIGLLPLEEKDVLAREKFNKVIKPSLLMNQYNRETLKIEIEAYETEIGECEKKVAEAVKACEVIDNEIKSLEETKKSLLESRQVIDSDVLKIDITTLRANLERKKQEGVQKKAKMNEIVARINEIGEVDFSVEEYDKLVEDKTRLLLKQQNLRTEAKGLMDLIKKLKTSEYCPTCGKKLDNVDNTKQIEDNQKNLDVVIVDGKKVSSEIEKAEKLIVSMKEKREKYTTLNTITAQKSALEANIEKLRSECLEMIACEKEYKKNAEAIDKNNSLDISIRNTEASIQSKRNTRDYNIRLSTENKANIDEYKKNILQRQEIIKKIDSEEKLVYNWKIYLEMVGKNGISKMVMRNAIPIINARIAQILDEVCDFDVTVEINERNEVTFNIVREGYVKPLNSGSGFEMTAAALALRSVLADISTISRMNFIVLDEILGRVASENYDNMKLLYDRISNGYDFVFHITHINDVKDWHKSIVTVVKSKGGVSSLRQTKNEDFLIKGTKTVEEKTEKKKGTKTRKKNND